MANHSVWNVQKRHEWLAKPLKKKRVKRRAAMRVGLLEALERKNPGSTEPEAAAPEAAAAEPEAAKE